ncbi:MAG: NAD(P)H-dependent oxidoreductase [Lachnospiraceae bacterium]|nr:NAD(P)H-dependent oxidoreductase [Lachnospiraceae bacterium]
MRIAVLNGSPKGKNSITLQTVFYLEKHFPDHQFHIYPVSSRIRTLEKDMTNLLNAMEEADLLIFSYPVYTFMAPSQLHRFMELLKTCGRDFSGKYVTQITTSKHFYDVTAHRYMEENFHDLGMKVVKGLSADMEDLLTEKGRTEAIKFMKYVTWQIANDYYELPPAPHYKGIRVPVNLSMHHEEMKVKSTNYTAVIVTDCDKEDSHLQDMIQRFQRVFPFRTKIVNIREFAFKGGCIGCLNCASTGACIYDDHFPDFLRNDILTGSAIVYAFRIRCHSMGWHMKQYDDRQFCNGHRTVSMGKPVGYLISGDYRYEENLRTVIEARAQAGGNYLSGVATDECDTDQSIDQMAASLAFALEEGYTQPQNFYGVGGIRIFRDLIYLMRGLMKQDHRFFKEHGFYDFPQKRPFTALKMYLVGALFSNEKLKHKIRPQINEGMISPYKKVIKEK